MICCGIFGAPLHQDNMEGTERCLLLFCQSGEIVVVFFFFVCLRQNIFFFFSCNHRITDWSCLTNKESHLKPRAKLVVEHALGFIKL